MGAGASRSVSGAGSRGSERRGAGSEGSEGSEAGSGTGSEGSPEIGTGSGIRSGAGSSGSGCPRCGPASPAPSAPRPWQDTARLATAKVTPRSWALLPCQLLLICCFVLFFNSFFFFFRSVLKHLAVASCRWSPYCCCRFDFMYSVW